LKKKHEQAQPRKQVNTIKMKKRGMIRRQGGPATNLQYFGNFGGKQQWGTRDKESRRKIEITKRVTDGKLGRARGCQIKGETLLQYYSLGEGENW